MKNRGAALPTVLALVTLVLVVGLAMGSLSSLSLRFNRQQLDRTRSEMAARSGLAVFLSKTKAYDVTLPNNGKLNPLKPSPFNVKELLDNGLEHEENGYRVSLHFDDQQEGYSTDNSTGEVPITGWSDVTGDGIPRVPPFALDLVFRVEGGSDVKYYRATLKRVWPFALYTAVGKIILMGNAEDGGAVPGGHPSSIEGDVYTQWQSNAGSGGGLVLGYGIGLLDEPTKLLANLEARQGYHPDFLVTDQPLNIGMRVGLNPFVSPTVLEDESDDETIYYSYEGSQVPYSLGDTETSPIFSVPQHAIEDGGNSIEGDFVIDYDADQAINPIIFPAVEPNSFEGDVSVQRGLALDPLYYYRADKEDAQFDFDSDGFSELNFDPPSHDAESLFELSSTATYNGDEPALLDNTLSLSPDEAKIGDDVPAGWSSSSHYVIDGSISNRQVFYSEDDSKLCIQEKHAGLELQDVVLHVKGDLDLGANQFEEPIKVTGAGATLIVDGQLILGNAQFDAVDQGFVIFAEDIVLTGSGEFRGLMIASNSISILSRKEDDPLVISGGLMCGGYGGVVLRGTKLVHEPRYLKSINGGGEFYLHSWNKLP